MGNVTGGIHYDVCRNGRWMGSKNCFNMQIGEDVRKGESRGVVGSNIFLKLFD